MTITATPHSYGYEIIKDGIFKVAMVTTYQHTGYDLRGNATHSALPRELWDIHYCSPHMKVDESRAIVECVSQLPMFEPTQQ